MFYFLYEIDMMENCIRKNLKNISGKRNSKKF